LTTRNYHLAISTVIVVVTGVVETCKDAYELFDHSVPKTYIGIALSIVMVASAILTLQELRGRLHILGRRNIFSALADMAFWITCIGAVYIIVVGLLNPSWFFVLLTFAACIALAFFGEWRDPEPAEMAGAPRQLNLFEWDAERRRLLERNVQLERDRKEYERFLKEHPDIAKFEGLPMNIKMRLNRLDE
jgi:hypothetical protein